jgi:uncharacterized protein (UPF0305 family)
VPGDKTIFSVYDGVSVSLITWKAQRFLRPRYSGHATGPYHAIAIAIATSSDSNKKKTTIKELG